MNCARPLVPRGTFAKLRTKPERREALGALRKTLGGVDVAQAREALQQMGGPITLRVRTAGGAR
jgi:hypothetical protein